MALENSNIVVEAVGLTKIFKDFWGRPKARAVNSIDFAIRQGQVCANGIAAIGSGHDVAGKTLILAVFPELYAIIALAVTFLIANAVA